MQGRAIRVDARSDLQGASPGRGVALRMEVDAAMAKLLVTVDPPTGRPDGRVGEVNSY
jgi:hypothetical protein